MQVNALDDPALKIDEGDVMAGRMLSVACMSCHGAGFRGAGSPGPDLRESAIALDLESFRQVVRSGIPERGMPPYQWLSDDQVRQLHAYIRARAREVLGKRPPYDPKAAAPMLKAMQDAAAAKQGAAEKKPAGGL